VNDDDLTRALEQSADHRVRHLDPRSNVDELMARLERRSRRQRDLLLGSVIVVLALGGLAGFLVGRSTDGPAAPGAVVTLDEGVAPPSAGGRFEPANVGAAVEEIANAFHAAYDGGVTAGARAAAIQGGQSIQAQIEASLVLAQRFGYTPAQLAGTTISLLDTSFIDETHAIVHFTISIPGHGPILADRVGYAVSTNGRWQVALRTACDLLSLSGLETHCPPR
jgi:hypothetical protein